jgi:hypothetical protein
VPAHKFEAALVRPEGRGTWTFLVIPREMSKEFGTRSRVRVEGTVDGHAFKSTLLPTGDGGHFLVVGSEIRRAIAKEAGERVLVAMERDSEPMSVSVPSDLLKAIQADSMAEASFERMAYSHRKAYVDWVQQAKKPETRESRIRKAVGMIAKGSREP